MTRIGRGRCGCRRWLRSTMLAFGAALAACSPSHDWRELRPDGGSLQMWFPCRPERHQRPVVLADERVGLAMQSCANASATFSVAWADVSAPDRVAPTLEALRTATRRNIDAAPGPRVELRVPGVAPNVAAIAERLEGKLPDGGAVVVQAAWFSSGLRVYQAAVTAQRPVTQGVLDTFFGAIAIVTPTSR